MPMILFCGDPHGDFGALLARAVTTQPDAIVLLGDQTPDRPLAEILGPWASRTWYILGNHDSDREEYLIHHLDSMADRNLHGRVRPVAGVSIGGLGGVFRGAVWRPPSPPQWTDRAEFVRHTRPAHRFRRGPALKHWTSIYPEDVQALAKLHADVLVTHEAPTTHPHGYKALDDLAVAMDVRRVVHGHHESAGESWLRGETRVIGLGPGELFELEKF